MIPTSAERRPLIAGDQAIRNYIVAEGKLATQMAALMVTELEAVLAAEVTPPPIRRRVLSSPALFWLPTLAVLAAFWAGVVWAGLRLWAVVS